MFRTRVTVAGVMAAAHPLVPGDAAPAAVIVLQTAFYKASLTLAFMLPNNVFVSLYCLSEPAN